MGIWRHLSQLLHWIQAVVSGAGSGGAWNAAHTSCWTIPATAPAPAPPYMPAPMPAPVPPPPPYPPPPPSRCPANSAAWIAGMFCAMRSSASLSSVAAMSMKSAGAQECGADSSNELNL